MSHEATRIRESIHHAPAYSGGSVFSRGVWVDASDAELNSANDSHEVIARSKV